MKTFKKKKQSRNHFNFNNKYHSSKKQKENEDYDDDDDDDDDYEVIDNNGDMSDGYLEDEPVIKWYHAFLDENEECKPLPNDEVEKLKSEAHKLLHDETMKYNYKKSKSEKNSNYKWMNMIMNKGTSSDKIAANILTIQDSPIHTLSLLRNLISLVKVSKKKECFMVLESLTDLFLSDLLRQNEKLREFSHCPLALLEKYSSGNTLKRKQRLIQWYYEDQLKELYHAFVLSIQAAAQDSVEHNKQKAISAMSKLLSSNPEQEAFLLTSIINKIGDPNQKVASKVIYCLVQLLRAHPNMKYVVMEETEKMLFRPNMGKKAQYYAICFLSQFVLSKDDINLARNLIQIYFSFFKGCVKKGDVDSRLMSALLVGVKRAYPYAKEEMDKMIEHIDTLYRLVHNTNFNVSLHTLALLFQVSGFKNSVSDRFYSALYKKVLDPHLATSTHQALFINLLFQSLKKDDNINRIRVFFKRLFQICSYLPVPLICGILYVVSQLTRKKKDVIVFNMIEKRLYEEEDDGEECYKDVKIEDKQEPDHVTDKDTEKDTEEIEKKNNRVTTTSSWYHCTNMVSNKKFQKDLYEPFQRNPLYAGGEHCAHSELIKLSEHFHPTVSLFANKILQGEFIKYSGDPLLDFPIAKFLDRFVFKNPKKAIKQEEFSECKFARKKNYIPKGIRSLNVDSASYLNVDESRIPADELFLYQYLNKKRKVRGVRKKKKKDDDDRSSVASEEFDEMMDSLMDGNEEVDFAQGLKNVLNNRGLKDSEDEDDGEDEMESNAKEREGDDEDEDGDGDGDGGSGDESDIEGALSDDLDDILNDEDLDDNDEAIMFDDSNDEFIDDNDDDGVDQNDDFIPKKKKAGKGKQKIEDMFVSAEKFSEMLEAHGASGLKFGGSAALSNTDNADVKQLKWETNRDFWMKQGGKRTDKKFGEKRKWKNNSSGKNNVAKKRRKK